MEWFEESYGNFALKIRIKEVLVDLRTDYQRIQVFQTCDFGKMLVLDGKIQLTEKDEAFYHEMLVHVPMFEHRNPEKVLIIGGGDGGSLREVLKHGVEDAVLVEIDEEVVNISKKILKIDEGAFQDDRVSIHIEDGIEFVRESKERFDVLIVDGTDPNQYSRSLISREFYERCKKICDVFVTQSQSPFAQKEYFMQILKNAREVMEARVYTGFVPTYPSGFWSYVISSQIFSSLDVIRERFEKRGVKTRYYNPEIHVASFSLPEWLKKEIVSY